VSSNLTSPKSFFSTAFKYTPGELMRGAKMYRDIITMCWSIREVNKNLTDRKTTSDYSIKYLKNACSELSSEMRILAKSKPNEAIDVVDKKGQKKSFALNDVAEMLYDARKIVELNLIDNIDKWARSHIAA
jgi:hypothetical protein